MVDFRFMQFSAERAARHEKAVRLLILDCAGDIEVWLGRDDLERHVARYGHRPAFTKGIAAYGKYAAPDAASSAGTPAVVPVSMKQAPSASSKPRVPRRIRMKKTVIRKVTSGATRISSDDDAPYIAMAGMTLLAALNAEGDIAAVFEGGKRFYVRPEEFDVIEWRTADELQLRQ
ncbi:hypothetical protein [Noviherbaspirillum galbum]|uniref:Uncharacterized protein n=1 Tax=Noviherbaspirillum galbum TaxID=2709383 RepID=A0A6B3SUY5_9BURK|nr:hypothetical protein [Noviherbaspirillum galbum]NEX62182.1 hypothetical protein [Noviherbaspirillum galbum]